MMLAIAITLLISGLFVTLIATIRASYYRTYNDNDCADIAAMYSEALENTILYDVQNKAADTIKIGDHSILQNTNTACKIDFSAIPNFNTATTTLDDGSVGTIDKWVIRMICSFDDSTGEFRYKFFFLDNYIQPGYLHYVYEGSFWIPNYSEYVSQTIGVNDTYNPTVGGSYGWDYNYTAGSVGYSVACAPAGEEVGGKFITPGAMATTIEGRQIYTRIVNNSMGGYNVEASSQITNPADGIPENSTVITIAAATTTPGGGATPPAGGGGAPGGGGETPPAGGGGETPPAGGGGTPGGGGGTPSGGGSSSPAASLTGNQMQSWGSQAVNQSGVRLSNCPSGTQVTITYTFNGDVQGIAGSWGLNGMSVSYSGNTVTVTGTCGYDNPEVGIQAQVSSMTANVNNISFSYS